MFNTGEHDTLMKQFTSCYTKKNWRRLYEQKERYLCQVTGNDFGVRPALYDVSSFNVLNFLDRGTILCEWVNPFDGAGLA
jgi:hypothetical protein